MAKVFISEENNALQRIEEKCIDCGQCLKTCQTKNNLSSEDCILCGQCIMTCPMGALVPKYNYKEVLANIKDEEKITVISVSPAVRVAIGDEFGFAPGEFLEKKLVGILKNLGFDYVLDTTFGADLTVMEEATELIERLKEEKDLPMFTSCCPSWVLNMEKKHPNDIQHLSTCKSPIGMQGAIIKHYFAHLKNLNAKDIVTVFLAPCVSKKEEIKKDSNNDYVITTSELSMLIREQGMNLESVEEKEFDSILGKGSGAGILFGTSGGVMEATLRTVYFLLNQKEAPENFFDFEVLRENTSIKEANVDLGTKQIKVAVVYGIADINKMYEKLKNYHFVEVMTCPNGCVGGAGQPLLPISKQMTAIEARKRSLYKDDKGLFIRSSYKNNEIQKIYTEFLKKPLSQESKKYLHRYWNLSESINEKKKIKI